MKNFFRTLFILIIVLACIYFIITSPFFIKSIIFPIVSISTGVKVTVSEIEISPVKGLVSFDDMDIIQNNKLSAKIAHFDTHLNFFDLVCGKLKINNLKIINSSITYCLHDKDVQESSISEIKNLNIDIPYVETNGKGILNFSSNLATTSGKNTVSGSIQGSVNAIIGKNGIPENFDLNTVLKLGQDTTPIICKFDSSQKGKEIPFTVSLNVGKLPLQPFFQAFVRGTYQETSGFINNLNINATAPNLHDENIFQTLSGNLTLFASDIYIPSDLLKSPLTQIMLIPLEVISNFDNPASFKLFSNNSSNIKSAVLEILSGEKLLNFKTGNVKISMKNGDANILTFEFDGTPKNAVQKITIAGTISKNQQINLNTITKISGLSIPLRLTGTLTNPQHDSIDIIRGIIDQNIDTIGKIIDAVGNDSEIKQVTKGIMNVIDSLTK